MRNKVDDNFIIFSVILHYVECPLEQCCRAVSFLRGHVKTLICYSTVYCTLSGNLREPKEPLQFFVCSLPKIL
jgi:hypothetical protein